MEGLGAGAPGPSEVLPESKCMNEVCFPNQARTTLAGGHDEPQTDTTDAPGGNVQLAGT